MNLIYIGEHFYLDSGTAMSSIYTEDGQRMDWGFVQIELERGEDVHIRQATADERKPYLARLAHLRSSRTSRGW
ncbi:MAG TPA: hypothetical protein VM238_04800 [Phycisphaerae bacterium]|nr:hypothetical protein [Phycisphaerae bacterium]